MKKAWFSYRLWFLSFLCLAATIAVASWALSSRAGDASTGTETPPSAGQTEPTVVCTGHVDVEPGIIALYSVQPGRVEEVLVHESQAVKKDTVLLRLDDRLARNLVQEARADLQAAEAQLGAARKVPRQHELELTQQRQAITAFEHRLAAAHQIAKRKRELVVKEITSSPAEANATEEQVKELQAGLAAETAKLQEMELRDPKLPVSRAEADVQAKQARLQSAQHALDECSLRAPVDGTVLRLLVGAGDVLTLPAKLPAVQFCPKGPRIVRAEVEQEYAGRVSAGQVALIEDDTRGSLSWRGKVVRISDWYTHRRSILQEPLQFNDVRTLECIIELDAGQPPLRIGQRVLVRLGR